MTIMTEKQESATILRQKVILELRAIARNYPNSSKFFHIFMATLERNLPVDGISRGELAAGLYPKIFAKNYDRAKYLARELLLHFAAWPRNKATVVKAQVVDVEGHGKCWLYFAMKKKHFIKVQSRKKQIVNGLMQSDMRDLEKLRLSPYRKKKLAEILIAEEEIRNA
jgi:hypothetical protein